ncbi:DUF2207 domain-containing protein [Amorphus sp. 3PC139-8]|uniref:DUF2207 domain-containing protein n=1 Tax=Amorphus sp. 3PC139-8 TaxID=2735676 RepID=UPI00345C9FB3
MPFRRFVFPIIAIVVILAAAVPNGDALFSGLWNVFGQGETTPAAQGRSGADQSVTVSQASEPTLPTPPAAGSISGSERIRFFQSEITVQKTGAIDVVETIQVVARGNQIRRGIYRVIPLTRVMGLGRVRADFHLNSVSRGGHDAPYRLTIENGQAEIRIGQADVILQPGVYTYRIAYTMSRQVGFFSDYDEIYWNVTGTEWAFPIERAQASIVLPAGAQVLDASVYTGRFGQSGHDATITRGLNWATFVAPSPLQPHEGLTVDVAFQKGVIPEPSLLTRVLGNPLEAGLTVLGAVLTLVYFVIVWRRVGRDPSLGPIIPVYRPELPPHAMRYLDRMAYDTKCLVAAILDLAVKGHVQIDEADNKTLTLTRVGPPKREPSPGEAKVLAKLFYDEGDQVRLSKADSVILAKANTSLKTFLSGRFLRKHIEKNFGWWLAGFAIAAVTWILGDLFSAAPLSGAGYRIAAFAAIVAFFVAGTLALKSWWLVFRRNWTSLPTALVFTLFTVVAAAFALGTSVLLIGEAGLVSGLALIAAAGIPPIFFKPMARPTSAGLEAIREIEGTRLYLTVAEADRLKFANPPDRTFEHFEELLPYAVALGVETAWTNQFAHLVAAGAMVAPVWYHGHHGGMWTPAALNSVSDGIGSGISQTVNQGLASIKAASGGSSGSFGGGFSGGGGGGGGGGGW